MLARLKGTRFEVNFQSNFIRPLLFFLGMSPAKLPFFDLKDTTPSSVVMYYDQFMRDPLNWEKYRVVQVNWYKDMDSGPQHELVVAQISTGEHGVYGYLCFERIRGDTPGPETDGLQLEQLPHKNSLASQTEPTPKRPSISSSSVSSLDSIKTKSNAKDTVTQLNRFPTDMLLLGILNPNREIPLCDLIILTYTIHTHDPDYILLRGQCYWFASMIMGVLRHVYGHNGATPLPMDKYVDGAAGKCHNIPIHCPTKSMLDIIATQFKTNLKAFQERVQESRLADAQAKEDRLAREQRRVARVIQAGDIAR